MKNKILIIGGDSRQLYMADYLESNGCEVMIYALPEKNRECVHNLGEAVKSSDVIIFPLPVSKDGKNIFAITPHGITVENAIRYINENHIVFGGMIDKSTNQKLLKKTDKINDYFRDEEVTLRNTIPTVQGILKIIIDNIEYTVCGCRIAVFGYGRTGKLTAETLKALGAKVTVCARKKADIVSARVRGMRGCYISDFHNQANEIDIIVNTIPSVIINRSILENLNRNCLIIDVASAPYGTDFAVASELGINAMQCPSLPGKIAPKTAGEIIANAIINTLKEENRE